MADDSPEFVYDTNKHDGDAELEFAQILNRRGQKITLYAIIRDDIPYFGWAICHPDDAFSLELGIAVARHRLRPYRRLELSLPEEQKPQVFRWPGDFYNLGLDGRRTNRFRRQRDAFVDHVLSHVKNQAALTVRKDLIASR